MTLRICIVLYYVILPGLVQVVLSVGTQTQEYCVRQTFSPTCGQNEIVILDHAVYGRMNVGKCLTEDFFLGCSVDVLDLADGFCSGRQSCEVPVFNTEMIEKTTCLRESLTGYLEASYHCQKIYVPRNNQCHSPTKIPVNKQTTYIASSTSSDTSCGLHGTPWILEAQPGQHIDLHMTDFSWKNESQNNQKCPVNYGYILDMDSDDVISICGGSTQRHRQLFVSVGHSVQIVLESNAVQNNHFLLDFIAVGCPDYKPPTHSWIQKENDSLVIGCVSSDKTWKLKCVDNRWLGLVGNCTPPSTPPEVVTVVQEPVEIEPGSSLKVPYVSNNHVAVFTLACVTLLVCCIIIILGVFCIKRYEVKIKKYKYNTGNLSHKDGRLTLYTDSNTIYRPATTLQMNTMHPPAYTFPLPKDDKAPKLPPRTIPMGQATNNQHADERNTGIHYENMNDSSHFTGGHYENEDNESVQYYVLENPAENNPPGQHSQYQRINVDDQNPFV